MEQRAKVAVIEQISDYDPANALDGPEAMAMFIADALHTGDAAYVASAMGVVARAKGMTALANETGLSQEQLHKSFSEGGNPTLKTILLVLRTLDVYLTARPRQQ